MKSSNNPPEPEDIREFVHYLKQECWEPILDYNYGRLGLELVDGADGSQSAIFGDPEYVRRVLVGISDGVDVFIDGTFNSMPALPNLMQLLIVHVCRYNHVRSSRLI